MTLRIFQRGALALLALFLTPAHAVDESDLLPVDEAFRLEALPAQPARIDLRFHIADGYYLYRHRLAVKVLDNGVTHDPLSLPPGEASHDEFFGDVETYRHEVTLHLPNVIAENDQPVHLQVRYQGCADIGICYPPQTREITASLLPAATLPASTPAPIAGLNHGGTATPFSLGGLGNNSAASGATEALPLPAEEAFHFEAIASSPVEILMRLTPTPGYYLYRDRSEFRLIGADGAQLASPQWPAGMAHNDEHFGDVIVYFDQVEVPIGLRRHLGDAGTITLEATFQGCQNDGICYPPMTRQVAISLPQAAPEQLVSKAETERTVSGRHYPLLVIFLFALGGGLILNLMPCVLPVLSLKALSLAQSGESPRKARQHALWYTVGVLVSFAALGALALTLRQLGLALGWGFQLQQPLVVAALAYLMTAVGLSLSGVFNIGAGWAGVGQGLTMRQGAAGDFFTGVLAVVVASPCTVPLMSPALAFAFTAPTSLSLLVFMALGLGLALPFLLIGFIPALARRLPRPGAWMETFKKILAFPMYLTAVWLLWILGQQRGVDAQSYALAGLVLLALALWRWESSRQRGRVLAVLLLALSLWPFWYLSHSVANPTASVQEDGVEAYSAQRLESLRAEGKTVFINMTADWCVTCKANEKRLLSTEAFRDLLQHHEAVYMKGDWTNTDPEITAFLEAHGAVGVPLYVVAKPGLDDTVLPVVPSLESVRTALESHP